MSQNIHEKDGGDLRTGVQCLGPYERHVCPVVFNLSCMQLAKPSAEQLGVLHRIRAIKAEVAAINGTAPPDGARKNEKHNWALRGWTLFTDRLDREGLYRYPNNDPEYHGGSIRPQAEALPVAADQPEAPPMTKEEARKRIEEHRAEGEARMRQDAEEESKASSPAVQEKEERRPLLIDPFASTADTFLNERPPDPEMLFDGCPRGCVMAMVASPGAGKSTFAAQMLATLAARQTFFGRWDSHIAARSLLLSVEDPINVIRQRTFDALHGLPIEMQKEAAKAVSVPPVYGHVSLFELQGNSLKPTPNFDDFYAIVKAYKPALIVLDTLSRFGGGVEGDNAAMSEACSYLEEVCTETNANCLVVHHTSKGIGGLLAKDDSTLYDMLDAYAARGASALTGSVRWQINLAPLSAEYAVKKIGDSARGLPDGVYVACRVSKKNYGMAEGRIFLKHNSINGLFERVEPLAEEKQAQALSDDVDALLEALRAREREGLEPVTPSNAGLAVTPPWGKSRTERAVRFCIQSGRLIAEKKAHGKGEILKLPKVEVLPPEMVSEGGDNAF